MMQLRIPQVVAFALFLSLLLFSFQPLNAGQKEYQQCTQKVRNDFYQKKLQCDAAVLEKCKNEKSRSSKLRCENMGKNNCKSTIQKEESAEKKKCLPLLNK